MPAEHAENLYQQYLAPLRLQKFADLVHPAIYAQYQHMRNLVYELYDQHFLNSIMHFLLNDSNILESLVFLAYVYNTPFIANS